MRVEKASGFSTRTALARPHTLELNHFLCFAIKWVGVRGQDQRGANVCTAFIHHYADIDKWVRLLPSNSLLVLFCTNDYYLSKWWLVMMSVTKGQLPLRSNQVLAGCGVYTKVDNLENSLRAPPTVRARAARV
jgi:hypothetical protein